MTDNETTKTAAIPEINSAALSAADFMFLQTNGTMAQRMHAAVFAYLYAVANTEPFGRTMQAYPSPAQTAAAYARTQAGEVTATPRIEVEAGPVLFGDDGFTVNA